jgi:prepilin-type N-terminal cleavage/methylation domain-containing protein
VSANINNSRGFTIVELTVALLVGSLLSLTILAFTFTFYMDTIKSQTETSMLIESQTILRRVADDMRYSSQIMVTNNIVDDNEPTDGWTTSNEDLILILSSPATDSTGDFIDDIATGNPYQNEFIYFADGTNLYKRVLANPDATDNRNTTTCPNATASPTCPQDPILSENFQDMSFVFYDQNGDVTTDPTLGRSVDINIDLERNIFGEIIHVDNTVRMTLRNPFLN